MLVNPDSEQWVEIYNKSDSSIDISGWVIDDSGGSQHFIIPAGTSIGAKGYQVFESGVFNLNTSSGDTARLLKNEFLEDSFSYSSGPAQNTTFGRSQDGSDSWAIFQEPTKGSSNNSSESIAISTPTLTPEPPTKTPSPTKVPTPTKTPTPLRAPTLTKTPTPPKSPTPKPISANVSTPAKPSLQALLVRNVTSLPQISRTYPTSVLGASTSANTSDPSVSPRKEVPIPADKNTNYAYYILPIIGASLLVGGGIFHLIKKRRFSED